MHTQSLPEKRCTGSRKDVRRCHVSRKTHYVVSPRAQEASSKVGFRLGTCVNHGNRGQAPFLQLCRQPTTTIVETPPGCGYLRLIVIQRPARAASRTSVTEKEVWFRSSPRRTLRRIQRGRGFPCFRPDTKSTSNRWRLSRGLLELLNFIILHKIIV